MGLKSEGHVPSLSSIVCILQIETVPCLGTGAIFVRAWTFSTFPGPGKSFGAEFFMADGRATTRCIADLCSKLWFFPEEVNIADL